MKQHTQHMGSYIDHIQPTDLALPEEEVHNVVYSDTRAETTGH